MIKAVLFDLDDTLISENEYIISGYRYISELIEPYIKTSKEEIFNELYNLYKANSKNVFNRLLDLHDINFSKKDVLKLVEKYRNHVPNINFYDDVLNCIKYLKNNNIKIGIISDGYLSTQQNKAKVLKLYDLFDKVIFTEELGREYWKPNPKSFEIMKDYFNVSYDEMIYVGDNPNKDFFISSIYPIKTIRIIRENNVYSNSNYLEGIRENNRINSLNELINATFLI